MADVTLSSDFAERFTDGETRLHVATDSVRGLCRLLDDRYPGLGTEIQRAAVLAIDGEMVQPSFVTTLQPDAAVHVFPRIEAG